MSRKAICNCIHCNAEGTVSFPLPNRGGRNAYLCEYHARYLESYFFENNHFSGIEKKLPDTFGVEFETSYSTFGTRSRMCQYGYVPTRDNTVNVEYKSPIFEGLNAVSKQAKQFSAMIESGELEVNDNCGTHTHFGRKGCINALTMDYLRRFYHSLFVRLCETMKDHRADNVRLFGRDFGGWSTEIDSFTDPERHTNFINLQHDNSIEFRICKFRDNVQYMNAVRLVKQWGDAICDMFINHFDDTDAQKAEHLHGLEIRFKNRIDIPALAYTSDKEYRKFIAKRTCDRLIELYLKAINA